MQNLGKVFYQTEINITIGLVYNSRLDLKPISRNHFVFCMPLYPLFTHEPMYWIQLDVVLSIPPLPLLFGVVDDAWEIAVDL